MNLIRSPQKRTHDHGAEPSVRAPASARLTVNAFRETNERGPRDGGGVPGVSEGYFSNIGGIKGNPGAETFPASSEKGKHERVNTRSVLSENVNPTALTSVTDGTDTRASSAVDVSLLCSLIVLFPLKNSECLAVSFHTMSDNSWKDKSKSTEVCLAVYLLLFGKEFENVFWGVRYINDLGAPSR